MSAGSYKGLIHIPKIANMAKKSVKNVTRLRFDPQTCAVGQDHSTAQTWIRGLRTHHFCPAVVVSAGVHCTRARGGEGSGDKRIIVQEKLLTLGRTWFNRPQARGTPVLRLLFFYHASLTGGNSKVSLYEDDFSGNHGQIDGEYLEEQLFLPHVEKWNFSYESVIVWRTDQL